MKIIHSSVCLDYREPHHPENPQRIESAVAYLASRFDFLQPAQQATHRQLAAVHTERLIESVQKRDFADFDSPAYENIYEYAAWSAGAAIMAQNVQGFSLMRPPGHHAGRDFLGGFCYFNSLAVAVRCSGLRTLIVDFDGHHGNGTEDIFLDDPQVTMISLHGCGIYPGTGNTDRRNMINVSFKRACGDEAYLKALDRALDRVKISNIEQIAVSAGFDAHESDPLTFLDLSTAAYEQIGRLLTNLSLPVFAVLEGGYNKHDLGRNIARFIKGVTRGS